MWFVIFDGNSGDRVSFDGIIDLDFPSNEVFRIKGFKTMAKFPPAFGMMGTVLGLIALLQSLGNPDAKSQIGPAMAIALVTTLYGIAINNLAIIPMGESLTKATASDQKV